MNLLDRIIATFFPALGLKRAVARVAIENLSNRYDGATSTRSTSGWYTTTSSADAEVGAAIDKLRANARDLGRNNPFVSHAYEILAAKLVGTGIRPRLGNTISQQIRERTLGLWDEWVDTCDADGLDDLYGLQRLVARTVVESGEALIRFVPTPGMGRRIPWVIRVLEPDYIDHSRTYALQDQSGVVILGVEYSNNGRRLAYHMFTEHPGANLFTTRRQGMTVERIPANLVAPVYWKTRPEQTRGVPWIAPCVLYAKNHDDLNATRLMRAQIQACYTAFVRKIPESATITGKTSQPREQQMQPGRIEYLLPEEDVSFGVPPQSEGDEEWQVMLLHAIAAGCGLNYASLTGDLRQVNYSSIRTGLLDFWALLDCWQKLMLKPMMCRPMWMHFDQIAGASQSRLYATKVDWDFPDRPFIDPQKDGEATDAALLAGRRTFKEVISSTGKDPDAHIQQLKQERVELDGLNLPHVKQITPQPQPQPANGALSPQGDMQNEVTLQ
jgi:lambda family phage portal protein